MADFHLLTRMLWKSLEPDSDGGGQITESEIAKSAAECPDIPAEIVFTVAHMMNERADGALLDRSEVEVLKQKFPKEAALLFGGLGNQCLWPGTLKLFSPDAESIVENTCDDIVGDMAGTLAKLGFDVAKKDIARNLYTLGAYEYLQRLKATVDDAGFGKFAREVISKHPGLGPWGWRQAENLIGFYASGRAEDYGQKEIILSKDFTDFADMMRKIYRKNVFEESNLALDIYSNPAELGCYRDPKNIDTFLKMDREFPSSLNVHATVSQIEALAKNATLDADIAKVKAIYAKLKRVFPDVPAPEIYSFGDYLKFAERRDAERIISAFQSPKVKAFDLFMRRHFGAGLGEYGLLRRLQDDNYLKLADEFGEKPELLLDFKRRFPNCGPWFLSAPPSEVKEVLSSLDEEIVGETVKEISPNDWEELRMAVGFARHPNRAEMLSIIKANNSGKYGIRRLLEASFNITFLENVRRMRWVGYGVNINFSNDRTTTWLSQSSTSNLLDSDVPLVVLSALQRRWGVKNISLGILSEFFDLPQKSRQLLDDEEFRKGVMEAHGLLNHLRQFNEYELLEYVKIGKEGLSKLTSAGSRSFIHAMRKIDDNYLIDFADVDDYLDFLSSETGRYLDILSNDKILGDSGIVGRRIRTGDLKKVFKKYPDLLVKVRTGQAFLDEVSVAKSVSLSSVLRLPDIMEVSALPGVAPAFVGIALIIGHPVRGGEGAAVDELSLAIELVKDDSARRLLSDKKFQYFCRQIALDILMPPNIDVDDIQLLIGLYAASEKRRDGKLMGEMASPKFVRIVQMLKRDFNMTLLRADMLQQILDLSRVYDEARVKDIISRLDAKPRANDVALLNHIARDPSLENLLFDRAALETEVRQIYGSAYMPRSDASYPQPERSERSPIEELDNLALFRLVLIKRSLASERTLSELGRIVAKDIDDKRTEYGGTVIFDGGRPVFNGLRSISGNDGSYRSLLNMQIHGGLMSYHLHALEDDNSKFTGPSGDFRFGNGGDWGAAKDTGSTDLVITTCGRVKGEKDKIWINIDMYYYDDKGVARIIDMGLHKVPAQ